MYVLQCGFLCGSHLCSRCSCVGERRAAACRVFGSLTLVFLHEVGCCAGINQYEELRTTAFALLCSFQTDYISYYICLRSIQKVSVGFSSISVCDHVE